MLSAILPSYLLQFIFTGKVLEFENHLTYGCMMSSYLPNSNRLSVVILKDLEAALRASLLFCFNPASIFYSSM